LTYDSADTGAAVMNELNRLQKNQLLELEDAAMAVKNEKGKVKVTQTLEKMQTGAIAAWGGFWGLLIGLIFGGPIFWLLFGAVLGGLLGKATDLGIDNKFIKQVGDSLEPGGAAIFVLVVKATPGKVTDSLAQYGGTVYQTSLSQEDEDNLKKALGDEKVAAAAAESHDLE
jgi:uncharacterized membrane protein